MIHKTAPISFSRPRDFSSKVARPQGCCGGRCGRASTHEENKTPSLAEEIISAEDKFKVSDQKK